jgi:uncharacterized oxidoreductase
MIVVMELKGNTILVTGGASGIGLALAKRFLERGNEVIICGRRADKLEEARESSPGFITHVCDVSDARERAELASLAAEEYPQLNVLVNNAGIQRRVDLTKLDEDWETTSSEIATNLDAPIHLSRLFYPQMSAQPWSAIINVTSGLSFVPLANVPVYCATKAALHSFTLSLRWQLRETPVEVIEVIPPAVDTDLQAPGLHTFGVNVDEFADAIFTGLEQGRNEIGYGTAEIARTASPEVIGKIFEQMNSSFH